jgi:plasmid stabilization system protein ParE
VNITIRTAAREDILRQFAYYLDEKGAPRTARRFLDAAESAIEKLRSMPDMGAPREFQNPNLKGLRSWHVPGFPDMRIYYSIGNTKCVSCAYFTASATFSHYLRKAAKTSDDPR